MGQPMTDLIPLENPQPSALFAPGGLESILARIEADARSLVPDISTIKGRADISGTAYQIARAKTYLDGIGKDFTADLKRQTGAVDAERKAMRDRLDALKAEVRKPLDDWEKAETDRVESIQARIVPLRAVPDSSMDSGYYIRGIASIEAIKIDESYAEFMGEAQSAKESCLYRLTVARDAALHREAEAARLAAEVETARAKAQAEREERIAREAAEQERARAEAARVADAKKQTDAIAAQQREVEEAKRRAHEAEDRAIREAAMARARAEAAVEQEKARAESARIAKEQEEAKRAADKALRERIHAEIESDLRLADPKDYCEIVAAIASGQVRHVRIVY